MDILDKLSYTKISLTKALLIFYLILANNYTGNLMSGQLQDFLKTNRFAKHIVGLITVLVLLNTFGGVTDIRPLVAYTILGYTWFTFTTKLDLEWNMLIFGLMLGGYLYENKLFVIEDEAHNDPTLSPEQKEAIDAKNNKYKLAITAIIVGVTALGAFRYYNKKIGQFGGGFNDLDFLLKGSRRELYLE